MTDIIIFSVFDIYLIGIGTVLLLITAIRYFGLAKKKENPKEKSIVKSFAWFFVFLTLYFILFNLSFFYLKGEFIGLIYRVNFDNPSLIYVWLVKGSIISYYTSFIFYFYTYEKVLDKRIHFVTFACLLIIILIIFLPLELYIYQVGSIAFITMSLYFQHTLFTLMRKSQRELRAATSFIIIGTLFIGLYPAFVGGIGYMYLSGDLPILLIFPALLIFGTFLCMSPTLFKPEFFSRNIKYWYLFSIILVSAAGMILIYNSVNSISLTYYWVSIQGLVAIIFYTLECVIFIRFIKREESLGIDGDIGVRGIFTKPEKVTEEEVSVSKEKKICLVCKGKVSGFETFLCSNCETFYCHKCARALIDLENACWACNTQIDKSKPVKLPEKEEEKVIVEDFDKKGKKKL